MFRTSARGGTSELRLRDGFFVRPRQQRSPKREVRGVFGALHIDYVGPRGARCNRWNGRCFPPRHLIDPADQLPRLRTPPRDPPARPPRAPSPRGPWVQNAEPALPRLSCLNSVMCESTMAGLSRGCLRPLFTGISKGRSSVPVSNCSFVRFERTKLAQLWVLRNCQQPQSRTVLLSGCARP